MVGKPSLQALWLVDNARADPNTGKITAEGIFDQIEIQKPSQAFTTGAYLFCGLREVHGSVTLNFRYTDLSDGSILVDRSLPMKHNDPLSTLVVVLPLRRIPVPHTGVYVWELICENEVLGSSRLTATIV